MKLIEIINKVVPQAMHKNPSAWLYEVQGIMNERNDEICPGDIYYAKLVFGMPDNHTLIYEVNKGEITKGEIVNSPWLEDRPLPHKITIDLEEAYQRMMEANLAFDSISPLIVLRHPLHPGINEPSYVFSVLDQENYKFIAVQLYSANVGFVE